MCHTGSVSLRLQRKYSSRKRENTIETAPLSAPLPHLLDLRSPAFYALTLTAHFNIELGTLHTFRALRESVVRHAAGIGTLCRQKLEHGKQEVGYPFRLLHREVVLLPENIR